MYYFKSLVLLSICLFSNAFANQNKNALDQFLENLDTYSAMFKQSLVDVSGEVLETSNGILYLKYPGQFHWQYQQPYTQSLITDGNTLWIYDQDLDQVTIKEIKEELDNTPAAILSGKDDLYTHFNFYNKGTEEDITIIELAPKDEENQFHSIRLGFEQDKLVLMVMFDRLGQITRVDFSDAERNKSLDNKLFSFTPPDGVDVIDGRTQTNE